jgi:hypothetical protein
MKKILLIIAAVALVAVSCKKEPKNVPVPVTVSLEMNGAAYAAADVTVTLRDLNGTASFEAKTDAAGTAEFNVLPGFYEANTQFKKAEEGKAFVYNGVNSNVTVVKGGENAFKLTLVESVTNQIVMKELYIGGCTYTAYDDAGNATGTKTFQNDAYVILYNNSDQPADASDICFAGINPANSYATNKYIVDGKLMYDAQGWLPAGQAIWWFDTDVTIEPWSQIVIAMKGAIDHTATYPESVDLSKADYVMYDPEAGFNSATVYPAPSASIPQSHYLQTAPYSAGNAWTVSVICPAFVAFKSDNPEALSTDSANYDFTGGEKFPCVKVPVADVVDGIEVFAIGKDDKNEKRLTSAVDAGSVLFSNKLGYTLYRNVDKAATEAIEGNKEKLVYNYAGGTADIEDGTTDPSGIDAEASIKNGAVIVYQDTNNSTKDFHQRKVASLK